MADVKSNLLSDQFFYSHILLCFELNFEAVTAFMQRHQKRRENKLNGKINRSGKKTNQYELQENDNKWEMLKNV